MEKVKKIKEDHPKKARKKLLEIKVKIKPKIKTKIKINKMIKIL
jgi:hypothetical protein